VLMNTIKINGRSSTSFYFSTKSMKYSSLSRIEYITLINDLVHIIIDVY
jgi:hypothetical protein